MKDNIDTSKGFFKVYWDLFNYNLSTGAVILLSYLIDKMPICRHKRDDGFVRISDDFIREYLEFSKSSIYRYLEELKDGGFIEIETLKGKSGFVKERYVKLLKRVDDGSCNGSSSGSHHGSSSGSHHGSSSGSHHGSSSGSHRGSKRIINNTQDYNTEDHKTEYIESSDSTQIKNDSNESMEVSPPPVFNKPLDNNIYSEQQGQPSGERAELTDEMKKAIAPSKVEACIRYYVSDKNVQDALINYREALHTSKGVKFSWNALASKLEDLKNRIDYNDACAIASAINYSAYNQYREFYPKREDKAYNTGYSKLSSYSSDNCNSESVKPDTEVSDKIY